MSQPHEARDRVERWVDLPAPAAEVWAVAGPFGGMAEWHPDVVSCDVVEVDGDRLRHLRLVNGGMLTERLEEEGERLLRYAIVDGPLPVENYRATLTCFDEGAGCRVFWSSTFDPIGPEAETVVAGVYEVGLRKLQEMFPG